MNNSLPDPGLRQAREDGRPLYYDLLPGQHGVCAMAERNGLHVPGERKQLVMNDPANSPFKDGAIYTIRIERIEDNAVIYDPVTNQCRDKDGKSFWREGPEVGFTAGKGR